MEMTVGQAAQLWAWMAETERLESLNNHQLADLVEDHFLIPLAVMTPAHDVLAEVVDRLRKTTEPDREEVPQWRRETSDPQGPGSSDDRPSPVA